MTRARIARGLTQVELGELLSMTQQQVQRYERDGWQKISLWRLAEATDALGLDVNIGAGLSAADAARPAGIGWWLTLPDEHTGSSSAGLPAPTKAHQLESGQKR